MLPVGRCVDGRAGIDTISAEDMVRHIHPESCSDVHPSRPHSPQVFKSLPHRLHELSGKTIAMYVLAIGRKTTRADRMHSDGTLITQRLHFALMPHPYRHVLGWYRLAKELRGANVRAICVFDGPERSLAKQAEVRIPRSASCFDLTKLSRSSEDAKCAVCKVFEPNWKRSA